MRGPWSLVTSRRFWEGFTPAALAGQSAFRTWAAVHLRILAEERAHS